MREVMQGFTRVENWFPTDHLRSSTVERTGVKFKFKFKLCLILSVDSHPHC